MKAFIFVDEEESSPMARFELKIAAVGSVCEKSFAETEFAASLLSV